MYHSPVHSCILLLCSFKSRFSETYFIHFTYGPMVIFDHLKQDFWSSLVLSLKQKKLQQICCHSYQVWFQLVKRFQKRRLKCKSLPTTTDNQDAK
jgi:hypothetical protein